MTPLVSIITINYNQLTYTLQLLESLRNCSYENLEIIVVDNASNENPLPAIKENYSHVTVIVNQKNLGFAGGNNIGITEAKGKYLLFLNNDTELHFDAITALVNLFENNPIAGIASPKILFHNSGERIQFVGSSRINPYTGRNFREGFQSIDNGQYNTTRETELVHGAAMMVPRAVIDKVGLMPEIFFLYYEEVDWCESIKKAGYKAYVVPASKVYHKESMSIGKNSILKTYYMTRNRLLFMRRHTMGVQKMSWILFFIFFSIPKNTLKYLARGEKRHVTAFWKGCIWNVFHNKEGQAFKLKPKQL